MKDLLKKGKDSFLVTAAKAFFQSQFSRYGELKELELDIKSRKVRVVLMPTGEQKTIEFKLADYHIVRDKDGTFFVPGKGELDRPWLQALYDDFAAGQRFPVPAAFATFI
jgi:hypothetical protein